MRHVLCVLALTLFTAATAAGQAPAPPWLTKP